MGKDWSKREVLALQRKSCGNLKEIPQGSRDREVQQAERFQGYGDINDGKGVAIPASKRW